MRAPSHDARHGLAARERKGAEVIETINGWIVLYAALAAFGMGFFFGIGVKVTLDYAELAAYRKIARTTPVAVGARDEE